MVDNAKRLIWGHFDLNMIVGIKQISSLRLKIWHWFIKSTSIVFLEIRPRWVHVCGRSKTRQKLHLWEQRQTWRLIEFEKVWRLKPTIATDFLNWFDSVQIWFNLFRDTSVSYSVIKEVLTKNNVASRIGDLWNFHNVVLVSYLVQLSLVVIA